jgi:hypothetical protein
MMWVGRSNQLKLWIEQTLTLWARRNSASRLPLEFSLQLFSGSPVCWPKSDYELVTMAWANSLKYLPSLFPSLCVCCVCVCMNAHSLNISCWCFFSGEPWLICITHKYYVSMFYLSIYLIYLSMYLSIWIHIFICVYACVHTYVLFTCKLIGDKDFTLFTVMYLRPRRVLAYWIFLKK